MRIILVIFVLYGHMSHAQQTNCTLELSGTIKDLHDGEPVSNTKISIKELNISTLSDSVGNFSFKNLCKGTYTIQCKNATGLDPLNTTVLLEESKVITLQIESHIEEMEAVFLEARLIKKQEVESLLKNEISGVEMDKTRGASLGEALKGITGVNSVQTGPSISKPMIHGLYGNRLVILNNGIRLESQSWGSDHAPEIDPFIASKLIVIKGASSIRYGMEALGGVVLVESKEMPSKKGLQGEANLVGMTNGQSGTASLYLENAFDSGLKGLSWRVQGTYKNSGAYKTPTYYLTNSGMKEGNYSATLNYTKRKFNSNIYFSSFNSTVGIYPGGEAETVEELLEAFNSPLPNVPSIFSYSIQKAYQVIHHDVLKAKMDYQFKKAGKLYLTLANQENRRSEFESEETNEADAYFKLRTQTVDIVFEHASIGLLSGSIGVSGIFQNNVFSGTEERKVVPDYTNSSGGIFILEKMQFKKLLIETGVRYDVKNMKVERIDDSTAQMYTSSLNWNNFSGTLGAVYRPTKNISLHTSFGIGWRPPSAIELYAYGIHQSAASFEMGDSTLEAEQSYNFQSYFNYNSKKVNLEFGIYYNKMNHFIYLNPTGVPIITDAGVFPGLQYRQADVYFTGMDLNVSYSIFPFLDLAVKPSVLYAYNQTIDDYLINIPSNRLNSDLKLHGKQWRRFIEPYFQTSCLVVSRQYNIPQNVDYVPSPNGYTLLNFDLGTSVKVKNQLISVNVSVNNALNTVYRDYLNRFRYFSNDLGRNIVVRVKVPLL